ncbi:four helix bundle protein [Candidatus Uhrbacteria bacterium]|nr:four helix bundle protein [Candidatus Uhrbacteria bacterium]
MNCPVTRPPPATDKLSAIPIIHELGCLYLILHNAIRDFQKLERFTLGTMIEKILLECIKNCFISTMAPPEQKFDELIHASALFDTLKLYIRIAVNVHCLEQKTYIKLIPRLGEIGRMLGGWLQKTKSLNPNTSSKS